MNSEAALFIEISRSTLDSVKADFERHSSMSVKSRIDFYKAHELPVKAILAEKGGNLSQDSNLTSLCKLIGLWPVIPPKLQDHLDEIDSFGPETSKSEEALQQNARWQNLLAIAPKFVFFIENQIICNPTVLKGIALS